MPACVSRGRPVGVPVDRHGALLADLGLVRALLIAGAAPIVELLLVAARLALPSLLALVRHVDHAGS